MTDLAELVVRIKADASQLQAEMSKATGTVKQSSSAMTSSLGAVKETLGALGLAFSIGAIVEFGKGALEAANNLYIMGQRTGFAASTLSALNIPLKQNGSSVDEFAASMKFMSRNLEEASPKVVEVFNQLHLSITKLKTLSPEDQFNAIADALHGVHDQGKLTADVMTIFGRSGAGLIPIIKDLNGSMSDWITNQKKLGALTDEDILKIHEWDDAWVSAWEHFKVHAVEGYVALRNFMMEAIPGYGAQNPNVSLTRPNSVTQATHDPSAINAALKARGMPGLDMSGAGNNNDLPGGAADTAKASKKALDDYIQSLNDEAAAMSRGKLAFEEYNAEKQAATAAGKQWSDLTATEKTNIDAATDALMKQKDAQDKVKKAQEEELHMQAQLKAEISSAMAQGIVDYKNFGATAQSVLQGILKRLIEMEITTPLVNSISGMGGSLFSGLFGGGGQQVYASADAVGPHMAFAAGGNPPVGQASLVGENGPELFVPHTAGTIIPNHKMGGVTVSNTFIMQPGLAETVNAAVLRSAPTIVQASHDSVMQALQKGGADSRVARLRA